MRVFDTHQHLWELERFSYSWCAGIPALNRSFTVEDYARDAAGTGIEQTLFVEADVDEPFRIAEAQYAIELAEHEGKYSPAIAGIVASVRPESPDFVSQLALIAGHHKLKGVRRLLQSEPDALSTSEVFRAHIRLLADYNLTFDICIQDRQLPVAIELVDSCPQVSFILDHLGNPDIDGPRYEDWRQDVSRLSSRPNIACKISGLVSRSGPLPTADRLQPAIEHSIECFGWDRVMFGSDWPLCTLSSSLKGWLELVSNATERFGEENQRKLFFENALRIYRCQDGEHDQ